jgi:hypothetical protein
MFILVHLDTDAEETAAVVDTIASVLGLTAIQHAITVQGE